MSIIIDLVIVAIIALCVLVGYHKGLTGSLLKIVSFVLALIIAFILFKPVSNFIIDKTDWDENLEQAIRESILKDDGKTDDETQKEKMPEVITDYINNAVEKAGSTDSDALKEVMADAFLEKEGLLCGDVLEFDTEARTLQREIGIYEVIDGVYQKLS